MLVSLLRSCNNASRLSNKSLDSIPLVLSDAICLFKFAIFVVRVLMSDTLFSILCLINVFI